MPPTCSGKAKTARSPAAFAPAPNCGQLRDDVLARSGTRTGRPVREASTQGPCPRVNCSSSSSRAPPSLAATVPAGPSSVINASPTPLTGRDRAHRRTRLLGSSTPSREPARTRERISVTALDAMCTSPARPLWGDHGGGRQRAFACGATPAVRGERMPTMPRTAVNRHLRPLRAGHHPAVGQRPHHRQAPTPVNAGAVIAPLTVVLDDNRHAGVADLGEDVEE